MLSPANFAGCDYDSPDFFRFHGLFASDAWDELRDAVVDEVRLDVRLDVRQK